MARSYHQNRKKAAKALPSLPVINPHAAGIDIGATSIYVSVPPDSSPTPVARFGTFTEDLFELAAFLKECGILSVAMESTGVYWIALYEILQSQGFEVLLVRPNYPKPPRKTDVAECQWIQYLHSLGLLKGSFRPDEQVCAIRAILRQRAKLVRLASSDVLRMQKSMTQMNLVLHNVISDLAGQTGLAIVDAILDGQRDPKELAKLRDFRIKASAEVIEKSLVGNYRAEHIFTLKQYREAYAFRQQQIAECDAQIEKMLQEQDADMPQDPPAQTKYRKSTGKNDIRLPNTDLRVQLHRIFGVDLTDIPGVGPNTVCTIYSEIGSDLSSFLSADHFASWLCLCPNPMVSGEKVLGHAQHPTKPRLAIELRQAVLSLERSDSYLGDFLRRMKFRLGPTKAIKATAHKLARIIYAVITTKKPYDESHFKEAKDKFEQKKINRLHKEAQKLGLVLTAA